MKPQHSFWILLVSLCCLQAKAQEVKDDKTADSPKTLITLDKEGMYFFCMLHNEGGILEEISCFPGEMSGKEALHLPTTDVAGWNALGGVNGFQPVSMKVIVAVKNKQLKTYNVYQATMPDLPQDLQTKLQDLIPGSVIYIEEIIVENPKGERRKTPSIAFKTN